MGWAYCGEDSMGREIGYAIPATCDHPGCTTKIDRGLGYACGGEHGATEFSCEGYFCEKHLYYINEDDSHGPVCEECRRLYIENLGQEYEYVRELLNPKDLGLIIWNAMCPGLEWGPKDQKHYEQAAKEVITALTESHK